MTNILILAAVALFLFWRLFSILGTRQGHESEATNTKSSDLNSVGLDVDVKDESVGEDTDIADYVDLESESGEALADMKAADKAFSVKEFISGAKKAYEMIIVAFESGDVQKLRPLLMDEVFEAFSAVIDQRANKGYTVDLEFGGVREIRLKDASFDKKEKTAEISISFLSDISSCVRDSEGKIIEGDPKKIRKQRDIWTFYKDFSKKEPNWFLSGTNS